LRHRINLISPCPRFCSFYYVSLVTKQWLELLSIVPNNPYLDVSISLTYRMGYYNILIDDLVQGIRNAKTCDIAWLDTALDGDQPYHWIHPHVKQHQARLFVCSYNDKAKAEKHGLRVEDVVPRPFSPIAYMYRTKNIPKKYDVIVIGLYDIPDRKGFTLAGEIVKRLGLRAIAITNYKGSWERIDFSSIDDIHKYWLIKSSKYLLYMSGHEGFGMPVLEAMSVGVPVIYLDAPAHNEYAIGYKIPCREKKTLRHRAGNITICLPDINEAIEITKYAIENYGTACYRDLSVWSINRADKMIEKTLDFLKGVIEEKY